VKKKLNFRKKDLATLGMFSLILGSVILTSSILTNSYAYYRDVFSESVHFESPLSSTYSNGELIQEIIENKITQYSEKGYFPQLYEANLQSIYFALFTLDTIDHLSAINESKMLDVIMSYYSEEDHIFIDSYAKRYLDTDFSVDYYPLNTLLEVNCYALLTLDILNQIELINSLEMASFIWNCYQPLTSGFIGQPYNAALDTKFKIATMDNTYFAVQALDLLLPNWDNYQTEVNELIIFINSLQENGSHYGFKNDIDDSFYSLELYPGVEPTILSCYYCVKTLEVFGLGALTSIRVNDFISFLSELYNEEDYYFDFTTNSYRFANISNIIASALGLELSVIYNFSNITYSNVLSFILNHRTYAGGWGRSTAFSCYELIDTYEVIYSLRALDETEQLTSTDRTEIVGHIKLYVTENGFFPLSEQYMSTTYFDDMISILSWHNHILDLDLEAVYSSLKHSIYYSDDEECERFYALTRMDEIDISGGNIRFRSSPLEYYSQGNHNYIPDLHFRTTWKSAFELLHTFQNIYKLEDYASESDFSNLISKILSSQFLNTSAQYSEFYGGFLPYLYCLNYQPERQIKYMNFEYSYYAIKAIELMNNFLGLGALTDLDFDINAFETHITRHIVESSSELFFDPLYSDELDSILENTYYMTYCLSAFDEFSLPTQKIKNFIINHLDYENLKNIYYSYKLSELLNLDIAFDINQTQTLVQTLFSEEHNEFYRTNKKEMIDQRVFYYICDLAKFSPMIMKSSFPATVVLGNTFDISVEFGNLVVKDYGDYTTVRLESNQLGTIIFNRMENSTYCKTEIFVPMVPENFPVLSGNISIYEGITLKGSFPIYIETTYDIVTQISKQELSDSIKITIEGSFLFGSGLEPLYDSEVYSVIYKNGAEFGVKFCSRQDFATYTQFLLEYYPPDGGDYLFKLYLDEKFQDNDRYIGQVSYFYLYPDSGHTQLPSIYQAEILSSIPLIIGLIGVPIGLMVYTSRNKVKKLAGKSDNSSKL
jgi:prenyltransferase beta subunit